MSTTQARGRSPAEVALRGAVVLALLIDAVVHLRLASSFQLAAPGGIGGGALFRVQAVLALVAGLYLLITGRRRAYVLAAFVLASAFAAVVLTRYVQLPALGPIPGMYEPLWYAEKVLSAVAEGVGAVLAVVGYVLRGRVPTSTDTPSPSDRDGQRG